jgi:hypothetical protein
MKKIIFLLLLIGSQLILFSQTTTGYRFSGGIWTFNAPVNCTKTFKISGVSITTANISSWNLAASYGSHIGLATLAGPTFTGNVTVPLLALGNNTNYAANTAWVKREITTTFADSISLNPAISSLPFLNLPVKTSGQISVLTGMVDGSTVINSTSSTIMVYLNGDWVIFHELSQ